MRYALILLACSLISAAPETAMEEVVSKSDVIAAQQFIFLTSTDAFNGKAHALHETIDLMGSDFDELYILTRGPLGDMPIELPYGCTMTVRDYIDRVVAFAQLQEIS